MIVDKITVLFFKVKLIDSYYVFGGGSKFPCFCFPQKAYRERRLWFHSRNRKKPRILTNNSARFYLSGHWFDGPRILVFESNRGKIFTRLRQDAPCGSTGSFTPKAILLAGRELT